MSGRGRPRFVESLEVNLSRATQGVRPRALLNNPLKGKETERRRAATSLRGVASHSRWMKHRSFARDNKRRLDFLSNTRGWRAAESCRQIRQIRRFQSASPADFTRWRSIMRPYRSPVTRVTYEKRTYRDEL